MPIAGLWALFAWGGGIVGMMIGEFRWVAPEDAIEYEGLSMDQASTQQTPSSQREWDNRRENNCDLAISLLGQG